MNLQQCLVAAREMDERYLKPHLPDSLIQRSMQGTGNAHLRWMVREMQNDMSENKAMRWLGYIQGVLVACDRADLEDMKQINMRAVA